MRHQPHRRIVSPVRVVDHDQQWRLVAQVRADPVEAVRRSPHSRAIPGTLDRRVEHLPDQSRRSGEHSIVTRAEPTRNRLKQLPHNAVRQHLLQLPTRREKHLEVRIERPPPDRVQQRRLPHPSRTLDLQHSPSTGRGTGQRAAGNAKFTTTLRKSDHDHALTSAQATNLLGGHHDARTSPARHADSRHTRSPGPSTSPLECSPTPSVDSVPPLDPMTRCRHPSTVVTARRSARCRPDCQIGTGS